MEKWQNFLKAESENENIDENWMQMSKSKQGTTKKINKCKFQICCLKFLLAPKLRLCRILKQAIWLHNVLAV